MEFHFIREKKEVFRAAYFWMGKNKVMDTESHGRLQGSGPEKRLVRNAKFNEFKSKPEKLNLLFFSAKRTNFNIKLPFYRGFKFFTFLSNLFICLLKYFVVT